MEKFEWQKDDNDHVVICLYDAHQTATISDEKILLRLDYLIPPGRWEEDTRVLQVALSRDQARVLSQHISRVANAPHIPEPPTESHH